MAAVIDGTVNRLKERVEDLEGEVFGPGGSAYQLGSRLNGANGTTVGAGLVTATGSTTARSLADRAGDVVNVLDFIPVNLHAAIRAGTSTTDVATYIQAAFTAAAAGSRHVFFSAGTYPASPGLQVPTALFIRGAGTVATVIKALSAGTGSPPTYTAGVGGQTYSQTLEYWPVLYNTSPLWGWEIADLTIDGGGFDVYGLRLSEDYYGVIRNVKITGCNKRPYINVRGQAVQHFDFIVYDNSAGALLFNFTAMTFTGGGFERNTGTFYLEARQPSAAFNKGSLALEGVWFEGATSKTPSTAFLGFGGRGVTGNSLFFTLGDTFTTQAGIYAFPSGDALTVDAINMAAAPAQGAALERVNYTDTLATYLGSGTTGCLFSGQLNNTNTNDASGNVTNTVRFIGSSIDWPYVHGRWQARRSYTGSPSVAATSFNIDVQDDTISFFESTNNFWRKNSGILEIGANQILRLLSGTASGQHVAIQDRDGVSDWESGHAALGGNRLWFASAGRMLTKSSAPSSATDGTPFSTFVGVPASATATGEPGQWSADASFLYVCHATNTWKRVAIAGGW